MTGCNAGPLPTPPFGFHEVDHDGACERVTRGSVVQRTKCTVELLLLVLVLS